MATISPVSYEQFASMRLAEFFPHRVEPVDLIDGNIGSANGECVGRHTHFLWKPRERHNVAEVILELGGDEPCPAEIAEKILLRVGAELKPGELLREIIAKLGPDELSKDSMGDRVLITCRRGIPDSYELGLVVHHSEGLIQFHMTRLDKMA